jgi:hypothetical protein
MARRVLAFDRQKAMAAPLAPLPFQYFGNVAAPDGRRRSWFA